MDDLELFSKIKKYLLKKKKNVVDGRFFFNFLKTEKQLSNRNFRNDPTKFQRHFIGSSGTYPGGSGSITIFSSSRNRCSAKSSLAFETFRSCSTLGTTSKFDAATQKRPLGGD